MTKESIGIKFHGKPFENRITQIYEDTRRVDLDSKFDLIMIDANHDTDFVISDTRKIIPWCSDGTIVLWHDFHPDSESSWIQSVRAAIESLSNDGTIKSLTWFNRTWTAAAMMINNQLSHIGI